MIVDNSQQQARDEIPLSIRLVVAALMILWAARSNRPWVVGLAVALAQPAFGLRSAAVGVAAVGVARMFAPGRDVVAAMQPATRDVPQPKSPM